MYLASEHNNVSCSSDVKNRLQIEIVRTIGDLESKSAAWNELALKAPQQLPMLSHAWVASYFEHRLTPGESWLCIFAYDGDDLVGVLPVVIRPHRLLGAGCPNLKTPNDLHTMSVDFLAAREREKEVLPVLLRALGKALPGWYCLELRRLPETSPTLGVLGDGSVGVHVIKEYEGLGAFLRTRGSFDDYRAGLSSKFKRNLKNTNNRVARLPDVKTLFLSGTKATEKQLECFLELEVSGWKGQSGSAISMSPTLRGFYNQVVQNLAKQGWLEWHFLESEGHAMVGQFAAKLGRTLTAIKIGYNESYARYSPGTYLYERMMERAFGSVDTDEINFLSDVDWLRKWRVDTRPYYNVYIYPRRFIPQAFGFLPRQLIIHLRKLPGLLPIIRGIRALFKRID